MISDISKHRFTAKDNLFFDTNIWFLVIDFDERRRSNEKLFDTYSQAFNSMRRANAVVYTNDWIISEIINSYSRIKLREHKKHGDFKKFRESEDFLEVAKRIQNRTEKILSQCKFVSSGVQGIGDLRKLIMEYSAGKRDFNDQVIAKTCRAKNLTLVTHDGDFAGANIPILTANRKMLRRR